jgi:hypothetical protein
MLLISTKPVAAIFEGADVSKARDYYYCNDGQNCVRGYSTLPPRCYCVLLKHLQQGGYT